MPLRRICVAWDASLPSRWALAFATRLARGGRAELIIAHVVPPGTDEIAIPLPPGTHVLSGRTAEQLVWLAQRERIDVLVAGTRPLAGSARLIAPRLRHELLASAPCAVVLVRHPPVLDRGTCLLAGGDADAAATLAAALDARLVHREERPPLLAVTSRERFHGLRRRLGTSAVDDLIETVDCPVAVARG
ncbi:universal stress protein [Solirubrobacter phytolaccae]|uniref:Universal stress protein n=1 Tax=Solirubrobacter phytolaccae TaxID=1404360 RepID=A0A9X3NCH7_9ACTN|nr:universal stress protein [Solirubrobacter phytolaccae]MDA0182257.1 universal stress protein [Solirubrobacter phytolaccae]